MGKKKVRDGQEGKGEEGRDSARDNWRGNGGGGGQERKREDRSKNKSSASLIH